MIKTGHLLFSLFRSTLLAHLLLCLLLKWQQSEPIFPSLQAGLMRAVPEIDLGAYYNPDASPSDRQAMLSAVDRALCDIGFLCIRAHPVSQALIAQTQSVARRFFELPEAAKDKTRARQHRTRGWTPIGDHSLGYTLAAEGSAAPPPDLFERYRIGPFDLPDDEYTKARLNTVFAPNIWPEKALPEFEPSMTDWYRAMSLLSRDLMRVFALSLGLAERWFDEKIDREMSSLAINYYPVPKQPVLTGQLRASAHTDYGTLTIVAPTEEPGGLQVMTRDRGWEDVAVKPGAFVVNIGDLMAQWTNDRWVSTLHRVVNPPSLDQAQGARLSLVYFHQPNDDARVECLPTCIEPGETAKYEPISAGEHIGRKIKRHFEVQREADSPAV